MDAGLLNQSPNALKTFLDIIDVLLDKWAIQSWD